MSERDQRAVLWLTCAAVCWRWLVSVRVPMPSVEACRDFWLAERLAAGDFAELAERWTEPWYGLLLAPAPALGLSTFAAAQVVACVLGGLAVAPIALAAERLRRGAGMPAAVVATVAAGAVASAAVGGATGLYTLLGGLALWARAAGRKRVAFVLLAIVFMAHADEPPVLSWMLAGAALLLVPVRLVQLRWGALRELAMFLLPALAAALAFAPPWSSPLWWPMLAVTAGVAIAPARALVRDVLLCLLAAADMAAAWLHVEPPAAVAERLVPQYLLRRELREGRVVGSTLPRVQWAGGIRPDPWPTSEVGRYLPEDRAAEDALVVNFGALVVNRRDAAKLLESMPDAVARCWLPPDLQDLAEERGLVVLRRIR